ncbi:efflux transporter outer membrane subunit [Beijerinckia sp. L45]|uniref:efflux transporter outer membrane subunit n=1 Tax=Beijerinckia sp. L45 TaxID=1641855 RepID=UPI00131EC88C|nr:efflux transporter outer membrane subunit [Beijerinckia sp. L45]
MRTPVILLATALVTTTLAGCEGLGSVGPDFVGPKSLLPATSFLDTGKRVVSPIAITNATVNASSDTEWWRLFHDPTLTSLEARVAGQNLDVRTATLRLAESRAQRGITAAAELPTLNGSGQYQREKLSQNSYLSLLPASLGGASAFAQPISNYSVGFDASWELDLWGHVRRQVEAADADLDASAEQRRDALVSSLAEVARDYVRLRGTQELIRIAKDNLQVNNEILGVTKVRQQQGLTTGLDTESAAAQVASIQAQLPQLDQQQSQQINAISLLLDEPPLGLSAELMPVRRIPPNPPRVPVGIPSELARRRPDIRMAEAQLHAATADIGVAVAEFYPTVRLNGTPTLQALDAKNIFKGSSLQYVIGPSVTLPIFEGGRLKSTLVLREHQQQEAAISYHKTVLQAWHDVVNAMTSYRTEQERRDRLKDQVEHARTALGLARNRYGQGVAEFTTVLDDARTMLEAEQQLAQSTADVSIDLIALYKALGGGWEMTYPDLKAAPVFVAER